MGTIRSSLLEKADFGKFQKENQDSLALLQKEKKDLRVKRKLKEAQARAEQVRVKFYTHENPHDMTGAEIKVGNKLHGVGVLYKYYPFKRKIPGTIEIGEMFTQKPRDTYSGRVIEPINEMFKPSQLKEAMRAFKTKYPKAESIEGLRSTGSRMGSAARRGRESDPRQFISLKRFGKKVIGKKLGLLGLGLSLQQAIQAGKKAYDESEGKM